MSIPINAEKAVTFITKKCLNCSKEFKSWECLNQKYCNNDCRHLARKIATQRQTEKVCTKCHKKMAVSLFMKGQGYYKSTCKACELQYSRTSPKKIFSSYKCSAKTRKGEAASFSLTFEQFMTFWQKSCFYCHDGLSTIGLDRIDNSKGYSVDNIVACCRQCNFMKCSLGLKAFIDKCHKIVENHPC